MSSPSGGRSLNPYAAQFNSSTSSSNSLLGTPDSNAQPLMGGYNTSSIGGGQVVTPQNWNDQPSYSGYSVNGSNSFWVAEIWITSDGWGWKLWSWLDAATNDKETRLVVPAE